MELELQRGFGFDVCDLWQTAHILQSAWTIAEGLCGQVPNPTAPLAVPVEEGLVEMFDWIGHGDYCTLVAAPHWEPSPISPQQQQWAAGPMYGPWNSVALEQLEVLLSPIEVYDDMEIFGARDRFLPPLPPPPPPPSPPPPPPPPAASGRKQRKSRMQHDDNKTPYVKKPPNAFMLFRTEQRPGVVAKLGKCDSAAVNTMVGKMWRSLSATEQQKYYGEAERLRLIHLRLHPDWSAKDNYGKKRKRVRRKALH